MGKFMFRVTTHDIIFSTSLFSLFFGLRCFHVHGRHHFFFIIIEIVIFMPLSSLYRLNNQRAFTLLRDFLYLCL